MSPAARVELVAHRDPSAALRVSFARHHVRSPPREACRRGERLVSRAAHGSHSSTWISRRTPALGRLQT